MILVMIKRVVCRCYVSFDSTSDRSDGETRRVQFVPLTIRLRGPTKKKFDTEQVTLYENHTFTCEPCSAQGIFRVIVKYITASCSHRHLRFTLTIRDPERSAVCQSFFQTTNHELQS